VPFKTGKGKLVCSWPGTAVKKKKRKKENQKKDIENWLRSFVCGNTVVRNETLYSTNNQRRCTLKSLSLHHFMTVKIGYYTSSKELQLL